MEKKKQSNGQILMCPNPLATSTGGMSADAGNLMPSAIHGGVVESMKKESSIDYPVSEGLCPEIWDVDENGKWIIKPEIKQKALELVDILLAKYHVEAKGVNVVGSICSNQYTDDGDVDIHIQVDLPEDVAEKLNNLRKKTQEQVLGKDESNLMVGDSLTHPLEFYFQSNIYADMGSCGCYDLMNDEWLSGPQLVDMEFDPYDEYESSWEEAFEFGKKAQEALFDLNKNLYKHNAILEQASNRDVYSSEQLMSMVGRRLEEVNDQILDSMKVVADLKEEMVQVRRRAGLKPKNEQEAEEMRTNKDWLTANSTFKFLQRLGVLDQVWLAASLYQSIDIGDIDIDDAIQELNIK